MYRGFIGRFCSCLIYQAVFTVVACLSRCIGLKSGAGFRWNTLGTEGLILHWECLSNSKIYHSFSSECVGNADEQAVSNSSV